MPALCAPALSAPAPAGGACNLPLPSAAGTPALPHVAAALAAPTPRLPILVVGSATVLGAPDRPKGGFPAIMAAALRSARPGLAVTLTIHAHRGATARAMRKTIEAALRHDHFALVLWQTGTVEAVHKVPPAALAATIERGARAIHAAGADLMLIDPLYSALLDAHADLAPYRAAMRRVVTGAPGIALLDRYGLMQGWAEDGLFALDHIPPRRRRPAMARLDGCIGTMLARRILAGAAK